MCNQLTLTTTLNGGAIDVSVSAPDGYGLFGGAGNNHALGFNVVGSEIGLSITNLTSGFTFGGTHGEVNGDGFFEYLIDGPKQGINSDLPLEFIVMRTGGFLSDLDLFETNSLGYIFAAHLRNEQSGLTGYVTASGDVPTNNTAVPEPASMILLGTGLLAAFRARKKVTAAVAQVTPRLAEAAQQGSLNSPGTAASTIAPIRVPAEFAAATAAKPVTFEFPMTGAQVFARACKEEGVAALSAASATSSRG